MRNAERIAGERQKITDGSVLDLLLDQLPARRAEAGRRKEAAAIAGGVFLEGPPVESSGRKMRT